MNTGTLNAVSLNESPLSALQRVVSAFTAAANVLTSPRVYARALLGLAWNVAASVTAKGTRLARDVFSAQAQAVVTTSLRNYTTIPIAVTGQASVGVNGTSVPRKLVNGAAVVQAGLSILAIGRVYTRDQPQISAQASITATDSSLLSQRSPASIVTAVMVSAQASSYALVRGVLNVLAQAQVTAILEVYRHLPYIGDAIADRTAILPEEDRVIYVEQYMTALAYFRQQPDETLDYDLDYSLFLSSGDTVQSATVVSLPTMPTPPSTAISPDGTRVKVWMYAGGVNDTTYKLTVLATTAQGRTKEIDLKIKIKAE